MMLLMDKGDNFKKLLCWLEFGRTVG